MYKTKTIHSIKDRNGQPLVIGFTTEWRYLPKGAKVFYALLGILAVVGVIYFFVR